MVAQILILASVALGVVGQLALKVGVTRLGVLSVGDRGVAVRLMSKPLIWVGLGVYGLGTFFWLAALSRVELGYAYPFLSLSYVLVVFASWLFLRERLSTTRLLGVAVICVGVCAVAGG